MIQPTVSLAQTPSNSYPTVSVAVLMTPEARLQQLEDMKHLLSAQEYAILMAV